MKIRTICNIYSAYNDTPILINSYNERYSCNKIDANGTIYSQGSGGASCAYRDIRNIQSDGSFEKVEMHADYQADSSCRYYKVSFDRSFEIEVFGEEAEEQWKYLESEKDNTFEEIKFIPLLS